MVDGKAIQIFNGDEWVDLDDPSFGSNIKNYRIKPEEEYVPFDTVKELIDCWNQKKFNGNPSYNTELEMPLIWARGKTVNIKCLIISYNSETNSVFLDDEDIFSFEKLFEEFTFLDGSPIGKIKG